MLLAAATLAFLLFQVGTGSGLYLVYIGVSLVLGFVGWTTLVWMLHAWRNPQALDETRAPPDALTTQHSFSLIVPARHEEQVLERTLSRLVGTEHPDFHVLVVVGADDGPTRSVAERVAARHPEHVAVIVDDSWPKNKPKALNAALPHCRGQVVGVFDAEDDVHPELLRRVDQCFRRTGADVVQAGVQLMNFHSSWFAVRNVLEYYFWFRSRLHFHARAGFIPLGGNTVFVLRDVLSRAGGWDSECLAEDCELGVRLSSLGAKTVVFYEPGLVTREETPSTLRAFMRQRTRWNQGYLQTLSNGFWRRLPLRQRLLGLYTLTMPYLMALAWLLIPVGITTAILVRASVPITLVSCLPAFPVLIGLAIELVGLGELCHLYRARPTVRDYARLILTLPLYQAILAYCAARAVAREFLGMRTWEKTAHLGVHLRTANQPTAVVPAYAGVPNGGRIPQEHHPMGVSTTFRPNAEIGTTNGKRELGTFLVSDQADDTDPTPPAHTFRRLLALHKELLLQVPLLGLVGLLQAVNADHWPGPFFDEGTYMSNAWAVQTHGALMNYTYGYGHPPLGWLVLSLWTWVGGLFGHITYSIGVERTLMVVTAMVSCSLLYTLARRVGIGIPFAMAGVCFFAASPLALWFHRLVLIDNPSSAWTLAAFVLALSPRRRLWTFAASGVCFAAAVLSKETTLALFPAVFLAAIYNSDKRTRRYCLTMFGSCFALTAGLYPLYAALKGELLPGRGHVSLVGEALVQLFTRKSTGNILNAHSQGHGIVVFWLHLDPWLLLAALALSPLVLLRRPMLSIAVAFFLQVAVLLRPGYLPFMYVIGLLPFAALIVAGGADSLWRFARGARHSSPGKVRYDNPGISLSTFPRRVRLAARAGAAIALLAMIVGFVQVVLPRWSATDRQAMTLSLDGPQLAAEQWVAGHIGHRQRLLVSDDFWVYLVQHGFDAHPVRGGFYSRTVVFYWQLDTDPAVERYFPHGWREFDYVISTPGMRNDASQTPSTAKALDHSRVVVSFGSGPQLIEVRRIVTSAPKSSPARLRAPS